MKIVIFGLAVSSSWGNGHATLWRGLCKSLSRRGHRVTFFEHDVPYYAAHRDLSELPGGKLVLYPDWPAVLGTAEREMANADVGMVTSFCPDAIAASELVLSSTARLKTFYDLDTPVTLARLGRGETVAYIGPRGLRDFDLVLSYTGGRALTELKEKLGAREALPLYGSVDAEVHKPAAASGRYAADLSYLGTYSADRDAALRTLFVEAARRLPTHRFILGGSMYDAGFPWEPNIYFVQHVPPAEHPSFYCSSRLTLNVTRGAMAEMGFCPSGRLFEAAACGVPVLSDKWEGLDQFFEPGREILLARSTEDTLAAIEREDLGRIARAARERVLACHTSDIRAREMEQILESTNVGNHSGSREGQPHSAAGVF
ncbi:MAG TPA: glycosyltransferase [Bryobacteraceae bacterium]|nr:glycosyltransferase [Bryobacteraceae bacterium]